MSLKLRVGDDEQDIASYVGDVLMNEVPHSSGIGQLESLELLQKSAIEALGRLVERLAERGLLSPEDVVYVVDDYRLRGQKVEFSVRVQK